jgi:hypothetical protein
VLNARISAVYGHFGPPLRRHGAGERSYTRDDGGLSGSQNPLSAGAQAKRVYSPTWKQELNLVTFNDRAAACWPFAPRRFSFATEHR